MSLIMSLPQEILDLVIDYVASLPPRYKTLEACALTCRAFHPRTLICRFRHIDVAGKDNVALIDNVLEPTRLSHVQSLVTSISITFPLNWRGRGQAFVIFTHAGRNGLADAWELHDSLPPLIRALTNVRSLHIQNAVWDTMLSPELRTALAAHPYVSVRLTGVTFKTVSQLSELLSTSLHLQKLSLSGTVFDTPLCGYSRSKIEVDCLEINHQDDVSESESMKCLYPVSFDSLRKLKICLLSYAHLNQLETFFGVCPATLRVFVVHAPRSFFPDPGTNFYPEIVKLPSFVHTLAVVLHDPPVIPSPASLWVDIGLSWWLDFIATASDHLVNLTIELSFFPETTDFQLWGVLDILAFTRLERLNVVIFDSHGRVHRRLEECLAGLKRRGILHVSFQWSMYEYDLRGQIVEDQYLS